ncbi:MAG: PhaM family polyhydroxyalkanoate granule multifunctional regulatory protein [Burkholderiales bacterium]
MNSPPNQDPLQFLKSLWGPMGLPFPGLVTPTFDPGELEKRIADLKSVQNWLNLNLSMIQATIQGLEMQKATLEAIQQGMGGNAGASPSSNPIADAWWNVMQGNPGKESAAKSSDNAPKDARPGDSKK